MKKLKRPLTFREQQNALADPKHPEHARQIAEWKQVWKTNKDFFLKVGSVLKPYKREVDNFLKLLESEERGYLQDLPSLQGASVILLINEIENSKETKQKVMSALARYASKRKRPHAGGYEKQKPVIRKRWEEFLISFGSAPDFTKKKSQFISGIVEEFKITRKNTLYDWIKDWSRL